MTDNVPIIDVEHSALRLRVAPAADGFDPLAPMLLTADVEIEVAHGTGRFAYSASDVAFADETLECFARDLVALLREGKGHALLGAVADALTIQIEGRASEFSVTIGVEEPDLGAGHGALRCGTTAPWEVLIELDRGIRRITAALRQWQEQAA